MRHVFVWTVGDVIGLASLAGPGEPASGAGNPGGEAALPEAQPCICTHAYEDHGESGMEACSKCVCEVFELQEACARGCTLDPGHGGKCKALDGTALEILPACSKGHEGASVRWQGGFQCTACGEKWGGFREERVVGMKDSDPCASCSHRADEHELDGCQHKRCGCKELVTPLQQQAGRPAVPQQPVTVTKADVVEARKRVAAREGTSAAALKQAAHRDRVKRGEAKPSRQKHDDSAGESIPGLSADQLLQLHAYLDGFARGADHRRTGKRHQVDPKTHVQWKRGYDAGLAAGRVAEEKWKIEQREAG